MITTTLQRLHTRDHVPIKILSTHTIVPQVLGTTPASLSTCTCTAVLPSDALGDSHR